MTDTPKAHIVLTDDDKFLLDMYAMKFSKEGYDIQACLSVEDALKVLRGGYPADVVLFDITMPERDGFSFMQAMRDEKLAGSALKIALTNQNDDAEKKKAEELGASDYIVKATMIPSEVVAKVAELLAKRK